MLKSPRLGLHSKAGRRASAGRALQHSDSYLGAIASCNVGFISCLGSVDVVINVYTAPTLLHQSRIVLIFTNLSLSSLERLILVTLSHLRSSSLSFKVRFLLYSAGYLTAFSEQVSLLAELTELVGREVELPRGVSGRVCSA